MTETIKVIRGDGEVLEYVFEAPPSIDQINSAMDGIGGRPPDRQPPKH